MIVCGERRVEIAVETSCKYERAIAAKRSRGPSTDFCGSFAFEIVVYGKKASPKEALDRRRRSQIVSLPCSGSVPLD
jgi:hypothetical protein